MLGFDLPAGYELERDQAGGFAEWLVTRSRWSVEAGFRVDAFEGGGEEWSPRLAFTAALSDGWQVRAAAARSFKLPSLYALGSPQAIGGNPELRSETSNGVDVGLRYQRPSAHGLSAELSVFHVDYEDLIDFDFATFRLVNRSEVTADGAELRLGWQAEHWDLQTTATYEDVEDSAGRSSASGPSCTPQHG